MSACEFGKWCEYFNRNGRCGPVRMFDAPAALISWMIDHAMGGSSQIKDFLPFYKEPEELATVADVFKAFGGRVKENG